MSQDIRYCYVCGSADVQRQFPVGKHLWTLMLNLCGKDSCEPSLMSQIERGFEVRVVGSRD